LKVVAFHSSLLDVLTVCTDAVCNPY
jgi:hypothetical protein